MLLFYCHMLCAEDWLDVLWTRERMRKMGVLLLKLKIVQGVRLVKVLYVK